MKLGFGLMRLPRLENGTIDIGQVKTMVDLFIAAGGTYFDTAFVYEGSEEATREALVKRYPRESYTLATKLNARVANSAEDARAQLLTSLERTQAGYFDYYLLHALSGVGDNYKRYEAYGLGISFGRRRPTEGSGTSASPSTALRSCWTRCCPPIRRWSSYSCRSTTRTGTIPASSPGAAGRSRGSTISRSASWSPSRAARWRTRPLS